MAETTLAPAQDSNIATGVGDAQYENDDFAPDVDLTTIRFGRTALGSLSPDDDNFGVIAHYDISTIPLGAKINRAKLTVRASVTDSIATTTDIDVIGNEKRINRSQAITHPAQLAYKPQNSANQSDILWTDAADAGTAPHIKWYLDKRWNVGSYAQAWTANNPNGRVLDYSYFKIARSWLTTDTQPGGTLAALIYEAEGTAGDWRIGQFVVGSYATQLSAITSTTPSWHYWSHGSSFTPTDGKTYITVLTMNATSNLADKFLSIGFDRDGTSGSTDNMLVSSISSSEQLQGFAGTAINWVTGNAIISVSSKGTTDANQALPAFTADSIYTLGDSTYSPSHTLANFSGNISKAIGDRESLDDWIAVRLQDFDTTTDGSMRAIHSTNSTSTTSGSLKGMLLTIDWEYPKKIALDGEAQSLGSPIAGSGISTAALEGSGISKTTLDGG